MNTFYLTTPLYYPNARPHVGSAYTTIVCDVLARYKRMCDYDVAFLTGTDEHGEKLQRAAEAAGMSPSEFVAEKRKLFTGLWEKLGINYSHFVYTDQPDHVTSVQRMLSLAREREPGVIEKRRYEGRYCIFDEMYVSEGSEPLNCPNCGRPTELISEDNYFFKLSAFQDRLLEHYSKHPEFVQPDFRLNEVLSFVKGGLRDISVSRRRIKWGIPWPDDPEQVFYVWYDALTGYLTGIGYAQGEQGSAEFQKYWRNDSSGEVVHMIGKDILRFHAVYWPAFLMAAGLPLPKTIFAHGWIYYEQDKMSKSKGNVVYPEPIVDALNSFGAPGNDALRYYLLRDTPFGQDASFSYEALIQRYNSDLANGVGNLASRTLTMLDRYFGGELPAPLINWDIVEETRKGGAADSLIAESVSPDERDVAEDTLSIAWDAVQLQDTFVRELEEYDFYYALSDSWNLIRRVDEYLSKHAPWKLAEQDLQVNRDKIATILCTAAEAIRFVTILLAPFVPASADKLWKQLGCEGNLRDQNPLNLKWGQLKPGMRLGTPEIVFPRLKKTEALAKLHELAEADRERESGSRVETPPRGVSAIEKLAKKGTPVEQQPEQKPSPESQAPSPAAQSAQPADQKITIDDFAKVDLRVGQVVSAEPIPGATKLLKLQVDIGSEVRQVCAGIAEHYQPEQLIGKKVVIVANLQPRKLRGVESNGMVVAASVGEQGKPVLVTFTEEVPNGARLK